MAYIPEEIKRLNTPMKLLVVDRYEKTSGVSKPIFKEAEKPIVWCNFKSYGGTEKTVDGRYVIEDTANITTWFRPDIQSNCRLVRLRDNAIYEIINEPEILEEMQQILKFKIKRVKGKA